ncbi:hypothetical protein ACFORK_08695 [Paenibacillus sp. GCM10012306]
MTKEEIITKFGEANEVVGDDSDGHSITYNTMFMVSVNDQDEGEIFEHRV